MHFFFHLIKNKLKDRKIPYLEYVGMGESMRGFWSLQIIYDTWYETFGSLFHKIPWNISPGILNLSYTIITDQRAHNFSVICSPNNFSQLHCVFTCSVFWTATPHRIVWKCLQLSLTCPEDPFWRVSFLVQLKQGRAFLCISKYTVADCFS